MYTLYLKYFKFKDELEEKRRLEEDERLKQVEKMDDRFKLFGSFRNESPTFQLVYITVIGWSCSMFFATAYHYSRVRRQGWRGTASLEPMLRPFLKTVLTSTLFTATLGATFVYFNALERKTRTAPEK